MRNNIEAGVIEPAMSKVKIIQVCKISALCFNISCSTICLFDTVLPICFSLQIPLRSRNCILTLVGFDAMSSCLQFATEAAITILRIDDMIKLYKEDDGEQ